MELQEDATEGKAVVVSLNAIGDWQKPGASNFTPVLTGMLTDWSKGKAAANAMLLIPSIKTLAAKGKEIKKNKPGLGSIVHELFDQLKNGQVISGSKYDLTALEQDIIKAATKVKARLEIIDYLKTLHGKGYDLSLVGLDQDTIEATLWLEQLDAQSGENVVNLFNHLLTHKAYNDVLTDENEDYGKLGTVGFASKKLKEDIGFAKAIKAMVSDDTEELFLVDSNVGRLDTVAKNLRQVMPVVKTAHANDKATLKAELKNADLFTRKIKYNELD
jgi:hypothetical protein